VFKDLEGSDIGVLGWEGAQETLELLDEATRAGEESGEESATASSWGWALVKVVVPRRHLPAPGWRVLPLPSNQRFDRPRYSLPPCVARSW
jgi:hypothetical protein